MTSALRQANLGLSNTTRTFLQQHHFWFALPFIPLAYFQASTHADRINEIRARGFEVIAATLSEHNLKSPLPLRPGPRGAPPAPCGNKPFLLQGNCIRLDEGV